MGTGILALIMDTLKKKDIEISDNIRDIDYFESEIKQRGNIKTAFIILPSNWTDLSRTIDILYQSLNIEDSGINVIFIVDYKYIDLINHYLDGKKGILAILDKSAATVDFKRKLIEAMQLTPDLNINRPSSPSLLTRRETMILIDLLNERPAIKIAADLNISEKTVSTHKRAALKKLGLKSLLNLFP
jgi:DNA-binding CsgD family transcriptional regulator